MPEIISKFKVFVASPSDLTEERESINEVISELNLIYGNPNNIVIELIKWETNSGPAISEQHVQGIINNDIGNYDLFIGLLWMKFGTPTQEFGSGTEEEFNIAYNKFLHDSSALQILFYFKNSLPKSLNDINPDQLSKVRDFRSSLGEKNVLYWEFNTKEELQKFLRLHIPHRINDLRRASSLQTEIIVNQKKTKELIINECEEYGILDYQEFIQESFEDSTLSLERIAEATKWIGLELNKKTTEVNKLTSQKQQVSAKIQRDLFGRTAKVMDDYTNRVEPEIPIYISNFEKGIDSFSKLVNIYRNDLQNSRDEEIEEAKYSLGNLLTQILTCSKNMQEFLRSVENLPRMSKELNAAKKKVEYILNELINKLDYSYSNEAYKNLYED